MSVLRRIQAGVLLLLPCLLAGCGAGPSKVDQYHAGKHVRDSVALTEQQRTLACLQTQLEAQMPVADSLIRFFTYEPKDPKYQDHGYYVVKQSALKGAFSNMRVMVRDDGGDVLVYKDGRRIQRERVKELKGKEPEMYDLALQLQGVMASIHDLEKGIRQTSLEIEKYEKRLQKK